MAWLHAGIESSEPARTSKAGSARRKPQADRQTRAQRFERDGQRPPLPPLEHAGLLARWLDALGPCSHGAMGPLPVGWVDISHWARITCTPLQPWQAQALRTASAAYVSQLHDASQPDCPAPWTDEPDEDQRDRVARQVRAAFSGRQAPPR